MDDLENEEVRVIDPDDLQHERPPLMTSCDDEESCPDGASLASSVEVVLKNGTKFVVRGNTPQTKEDRLRGLRSDCVRQLRIKYGLMKRNKHNERIYRNAAIQFLDELGVKAYDRFVLLPQVLACVYIPTVVEIEAADAASTELAVTRRYRLEYGARYWRGWFWKSRKPEQGLRDD